MSPYAKPTVLLVAGYLIIATVLIVPRVIYNYRQTGRINVSHRAIKLSFIIYMLVLFFLISRPIHSDYHENLLFADKQPQQLELFHVFKRIKGASDPALFAPAFYQAVFSFLMLLPLGIYYYVFKGKGKYGWAKILGIALACSLFFEVSQLTGLFGLYAHPYRLFDVDDIWLNTLGAIVGYYLAPILIFFMPDWSINIEGLDDETRTPYSMQLVEVYINVLIANFMAILLNSLIGSTSGLSKLLFSTFFYMLISVAMPRMMKGMTIAGYFLNIRLIPDQTKNYCPYLVRMMLLYVPLWFNELALWVCSIKTDDGYIISVQVIFFFVTAFLWMIIYFDIFMKWYRGATAPYYNEKSGIKAKRV